MDTVLMGAPICQELLICFSHLLAACLEGGQQLAGEGYGEIIGQVAVFWRIVGDIEAYTHLRTAKGIRPANIRQPFAAGAARSGHAPFDKQHIGHKAGCTVSAEFGGMTVAFVHNFPEPNQCCPRQGPQPAESTPPCWGNRQDPAPGPPGRPGHPTAG